MIEASAERSPSESSADFYDAEEKIRLTPHPLEDPPSLEAQKSPMILDDRYLSSEEALSPMADTTESGTEDDMTSIYETEILTPTHIGRCKMAIAVCIISVGRPRIIDLPTPSLSPASSMSSKFSRPSRVDSLPSHSPALSPNIGLGVIPRPLHHQPTPIEEERPNTSYTQDSVALEESPKSERTQSPIPLSAASTPSFLDTDPFANTAPRLANHSRLRNLSQKFSRIAILNASKPDSYPSILPPTPTTKLKKSILSRRGSVQSSRSPMEPSFGTTGRPDSPKPRSRMVPRGAAERAPPIELPPFPGDDDEGVNMGGKINIIRRKSVLRF
jgi:hypothetical protein